jgi:hypothetical protein
MRLPHVAGKKMYVDSCGDTAAVADSSSPTLRVTAVNSTASC